MEPELLAQDLQVALLRLVDVEPEEVPRVEQRLDLVPLEVEPVLDVAVDDVGRA